MMYSFFSLIFLAISLVFASLIDIEFFANILSSFVLFSLLLTIFKTSVLLGSDSLNILSLISKFSLVSAFPLLENVWHFSFSESHSLVLKIFSLLITFMIVKIFISRF